MKCNYAALALAFQDEILHLYYPDDTENIEVLQYDIQRLENMKANDIYNIIPMVIHLQYGASLFGFADGHLEKRELFKVMDKMVTGMPDGKVLLSYCILLAITDQYILENWRKNENTKKEHDMLSLPIDMLKIDKIVPNYRRMVEDYKIHLKN